MSATSSLALVTVLDVLVLTALAAVCLIPFRLDRSRPAAPVRRLDPLLEPDLAERHAA